MNTCLFTMPGAQSLAEDVADHLGQSLGHIKEHTFPDGETLFRILDPVIGQHVCLIARLDNPDPKALQLLMLAEGFRQQGAASVTLVAPYLPYMRQDIAFQPGEVISARVFAKLISASFDHLITVDPHLHRFQTLDELYTIPAHCVSAATPMAQWISEHASRPLIVGPDIESAQWVSQIADQLDAPFATLRKTRKGDRDVEIRLPDLDLNNVQTLALVDDIVSSGTTMLRTIARLRSHYPDREIVCCAAHCLASPAVFEAFTEAGVKAFACTDTVRHPGPMISISDEIAKAIASF